MSGERPDGARAAAPVAYRREDSGHPPHGSAGYASTRLRTPREPLIRLRHTPTEVSGPGPGWRGANVASAADLTRGGAVPPIGQRIIVSGRVLDEGRRAIPGAMLEIWQANAAGRYRHDADQWDAPLDPNFTGVGAAITDSSGCYRFTTVRPGAYPWGNHANAWRPAHIHLSLLGPAFATRLVTQMYFPEDPLIAHDPIADSVPATHRHRLISRFDVDTTVERWALGYVFDIVLRGADATPMEP